MNNLFLYGSPWLISGARALVTAFTTGGLAVLAVLSQTQDPLTLLIAGGVPFLTVIGTRFGVEGAIDRNQPDAVPGPQPK